MISFKRFTSAVTTVALFTTLAGTAGAASPFKPTPKPPIDDAQCMAAVVPPQLKPGQKFNAIALMRNTGTTTWTNPQYFLSSSASGSPQQTPLPRKQVRPLEVVNFVIPSTAPQQPGTYTFAANMIHTNTGFGKQCLKTFTVVSQEKPQCSDKIDNDGDGNIDFPKDKGCTSPKDNNEGDGPTDFQMLAKGPSTAIVGSTVTYQTLMTNLGPDAGFGNMRVDVLSGEKFVPEQSDPSCALESSTTIRCADGTFKAGQSKSIAIAFNLSQALGGTQLKQHFFVSETPQGDPRPSNNEAWVTTAVTAAQSSITVAASSTNPTGDSVPKGANVHMLSLDLTASCDGDQTIEAITVKHAGNGLPSAAESLYAVVRDQRATRPRTFDPTDNTAPLRFSTPLVVRACKTEIVQIFVDLSSSATTGDSHGVFVPLPSDIIVSGGASVLGPFPIKGPLFKVAAVQSGIVGVTYKPITQGQIEVSDKNIVIGKFEASASVTEDQTFYTMTLKQMGTASNGDLKNIRIRRTDGTVLTADNDASLQFNNGFTTLTFSPPFTILEGDKTTFEVIADINGGAGKTVQVGFDEPTDISAVGSLYGYGVNGQLYLSPVTISPTPTPSTIQIEDAVANTTLTVAVKALATTDTAVANAKNKTLLRFEGRAAEADVLLTKAVFGAQAGSPLNANNYALWADTNGDGIVDTILQKGVASQSGNVVFDGLAGGGYIIPKDVSMFFEVHADIASALTGNQLQLTFLTQEANYVEAEQVSDGSSLLGIETNGVCNVPAGCRIRVTTVDSTLWTLYSQGNLYVTRDSQLPQRQLLGGALGEPVLRLNLRAEHEDIDVSDLQINSSGSLATSVDRLEIWLVGATNPLAMGMNVGCGSSDVLSRNGGSGNPATTAFCFTMDSQQLVVPKNAEVKILVKPRLKSDVEGAVSGEQFGLFFDHTAASNDATGTGAVRARGIESSNNLAANDGDSTAEGEVFIGQPTAAPNSRIIGNDNEVVLSKITSITNGGPATGSVPGGVDQQIGSFTFAAAANANTKNGPNQATMNGIVFSVNATNVNLAYDGLKIYNKAAGSTQNATCTPWTTNGVQLTSGNVSGSILVKCSDLITGGIVNTAVDQGSSITLVLLANVTNTNTAASSGGSSILQVSLNEFTNITKKIFGTWPSRSHIEWQDRDAASSQTFRWIEYPDTAVNSTTYHG